MQLRGLAPTRTRAQALILAGRIRIDGQLADKPGQLVRETGNLRCIGDPPAYASRAGAKLAAALDAFAIDVTGRIAVDVGASTGGFTDCLLQRGAARVHAVDCGSGQLLWRLRQDPRVRLRERTNARYLAPDALGERAAVMTVDVSFISVRTLLPALVPLLEPGADVIVLVKPQFEAGRGSVGKGGIVRDPAVRAAAVDAVTESVRAHGLDPRGVIPSPVLGAGGNQEYLLWARRVAA